MKNNNSRAAAPQLQYAKDGKWLTAGWLMDGWRQPPEKKMAGAAGAPSPPPANQTSPAADPPP